MNKPYLHFALLFSLLVSLPFCALATADKDQDKSGTGVIYKTIGPDGKVMFTDTPPAGKKAEKITMKPTNVQPIALPRTLPNRKLSPASEQRQQAEGPIDFAIVSPANDATIPPGQNYIVLQVAMDPLPRGGYEFFAVIDGQRWSGSSTGSSLDISALERGSHSVQAVLLGSNGQVLAQSQTIQLHVHRPGGRVPDFPAGQAAQAPKAPQAPGLYPPPKQPRR